MPVHFSILAALCMFILMPVMPLKPMAIPVIIGDGISGALLMTGRSPYLGTNYPDP
jgi:hypothetical protein